MDLSPEQTKDLLELVRGIDKKIDVYAYRTDTLEAEIRELKKEVKEQDHKVTRWGGAVAVLALVVPPIVWTLVKNAWS